MILSGTIIVTRSTAEKLAASAEEHKTSVGRQASLIVEAAARVLYAQGRTTAVPPTADSFPTPIVPIHISLPSKCLVWIADAAMTHGLTLDAQLRAIVDAGVARYKPPPGATKELPPSLPVAMKGQPSPSKTERVKAVPTRKPFDPSFYARRAIIPDAAAAPSASVTARLMGDPGVGMSLSAARAGIGGGHD